MCRPITSASLEEIHQGFFVLCYSVVLVAPTLDIFKLPLNPRAQVKLSITNAKSSPPRVTKPQPRRNRVTVHQP